MIDEEDVIVACFVGLCIYGVYLALSYMSAGLWIP
jgi:hypothetical protein